MLALGRAWDGVFILLGLNFSFSADYLGSGKSQCSCLLRLLGFWISHNFIERIILV